MKQRIYRKIEDVLIQLKRVEQSLGRITEREGRMSRDKLVVGADGARRNRGKRKVIQVEESGLEGSEPKRVKDWLGVEQATGMLRSEKRCTFTGNETCRSEHGLGNSHGTTVLRALCFTLFDQLIVQSLEIEAQHP